MIKYLGNLEIKIKILWCYLLWYLFFVIKYFDTDPYLWTCSLGISVLVGFALNINSYDSLADIIKSDNKWKILRFFIIPFYVSSFPAVIKDKGFILFFSSEPAENFYAILICLFFWLLTNFCHKYLNKEDLKL